MDHIPTAEREGRRGQTLGFPRKAGMEAFKPSGCIQKAVSMGREGLCEFTPPSGVGQARLGSSGAMTSCWLAGGHMQGREPFLSQLEGGAGPCRDGGTGHG